MKVAAYLRVSDDKQTVENQRPDVERYARDRGWEISHWYVETVSGASRSRPEYARMLADARARKFEALIFWRLDRFGRGGILPALSAVETLDRQGVALCSVRESWMDTTGPARELLIAIFAWVAKEERRVLIERTRAGLDRARAEGIRLGRPRALNTALARARAALAQGASLADAVKATEYLDDRGKPRRLSVSTLYRYGISRGGSHTKGS